MQFNADGSVVGHKGMKYGLQKPVMALGKSRPGAPGAVSRVPKPVAASNVFGDDSDEEGVGAQVARQADQKRSAAKVQQIYEAALAEDPSAFDYDGVYDAMHDAREKPKQADKLARQSKYIAQLKQQAEQRKREEDIRYERKVLKEQAAEEEQYAGKEKFVTGAYRRKLEEDKKWAAEQEARDAESERNEASKVGHMGHFYANLLSNNVAFGTAPKPKPAAAAAPDATGTAGDSKPEPQGDVTTAAIGAGATDMAKALGIVPAKGPELDRYDQLRLRVEQARAAQVPQEPSQGSLTGQEEPGEQPTSSTGQGEGTGDGEAPGVAAASAAAAVPVAKRRNDDTSVMSAKERYLARKKQHVAG